MTGNVVCRNASSPTLDPLAEALDRLIGPLIRREILEALADLKFVCQPSAELATIEQACNALQVSRATFHRLRLQGLPTIMLLDSPRFRIAEIVEWAQSQSKPQRGSSAEVSQHDSDRSRERVRRLTRGSR